MRVLHVISNYQLGESQLAVLEFCRVARLCGVRASVLALSSQDGVARDLLDAQLIPTQTLASTAAGALNLQLQQTPVDVVHTHDPEVYSAVYPAVVDSNVRLVHTFHGSRQPELEQFPAGSSHLGRTAWVRGADTRRWAEVWERTELDTIPDGVWSPPLEDLRPAARRAALGAPSDRFVVGAAGLTDTAAAIELLARFRRELDSQDVDGHLVVFGEPSGDSRARPLHFVDPEDTNFVDHLEGLDVFAQPTGDELSKLALSALARRVPVILPGVPRSSRPGARWSPLRFAPGDPAGASTQLLRYANDPELLEQHRGLARDHVLTYRDSMSMVSAYVRVYERRSSECASC
jgi:hypothetical protein